MIGRVCAITGASSGLGFQTALELAEMGATVAMLCRNSERGEAAREHIVQRTANADVHVVQCDHADLSSVRDAAAQLERRFDALHVLVNNAGLLMSQHEVTIDGVEHGFQVNHLSAFLLTSLLRERLQRSAPSRVVTVSSLAHRAARLDFDDLQFQYGYNGWDAYARTKLANVLFTYELARRLEGTGVTANALHPGLVRSGFGRNNGTAMRAFMTAVQLSPFAVSVRRGARTQIYLASSPEVQQRSGRYFGACRERRSSKPSYDVETQRRLWQASEELIEQAG